MSVVKFHQCSHKVMFCPLFNHTYIRPKILIGHVPFSRCACESPIEFFNFSIFSVLEACSAFWQAILGLIFQCLSLLSSRGCQELLLPDCHLVCDYCFLCLFLAWSLWPFGGGSLHVCYLLFLFVLFHSSFL